MDFFKGDTGIQVRQKFAGLGARNQGGSFQLIGILRMYRHAASGA